MSNWLIEDVKKMADSLFERARSIREGGDEVSPTIFLFVNTPKETEEPTLLIVSDATSRSKDEHRLAIESMVRQTGAVYVARVDEAWSVRPNGDKDEEVASQAWIKSGRSLENYPGRIEVVHLVIDGPGFSRMYNCTILGERTLGPTEIVDSGNVTGRFTNLSGRLGED